MNADEALRTLSDAYWTNVTQAKRMAEAIDTVGLEIESLRRRKRDLAEIMTADEIIAIERQRITRELTREAEGNVYLDIAFVLSIVNPKEPQP